MERESMERGEEGKRGNYIQAEVRGDRKNTTAVVTISGFVNARWFFRHRGRFLSSDYVIRSRSGQVPTSDLGILRGRYKLDTMLLVYYSIRDLHFVYTFDM